MDAARRRNTSNLIMQLKSFIPSGFGNRKGYELKHLGKWKATEFRLFVLYTGIVAL